MQKPCKNNFHRVLIVGVSIIAQFVDILNSWYNKDVALEHYVVFLSDVRQTARKGSLFLLFFMPDCVILKSAICEASGHQKHRCFSFSVKKEAPTNCEGSEGKTWKKGFCFLVEVIGE